MADLDAVQARLDRDPRPATVPSSRTARSTAFASLVLPGAGGHDYFVALRRWPGDVALYLIVADRHPDDVALASSELQACRTGRGDLGVNSTGAGRRPGRRRPERAPRDHRLSSARKPRRATPRTPHSPSIRPMISFWISVVPP